MAQIKAFGKPVGDIVMKRSYASQQSLLDATQPKGRRYYWKSEYLPGISQDLLGAYMKNAATINSPHSAILLFPLDGALNKLPAGHSPAGNRDAKAVLNIAASWEKATDDAEHVEGARAVWRDMKRFSTGGTYVNFLTEEEVGERVAAAYGTHMGRLATVKHAWDPGNLFRTNKNIQPG